MVTSIMTNLLSECFWSTWKILYASPALALRVKRLSALSQLPYSSGRAFLGISHRVISNPQSTERISVAAL